MKKHFKFLCGSVAFLFSLLFATSVFASAPQITQVRFKNAGDSNKLFVQFDQPVYSTPSASAALGQGDFAIGGSVGGSATTTATDHSMNPPSSIVVLTVNQNINATTTGLWTIAAADGQIFNAQGESATTTAVDLGGNGDSVAPTVIGVFQHSAGNLDVMFSEEVDGVGATAITSYVNLTTSAAGDTPVVTGAQLVPEKRFAILTVSASTTLGWGADNAIDIGSIQDIVGNPISGTSTVTILPTLKISEVKAEASANTTDEFIEVYNFGDVAIDASNLYLHIKNGSTDTTVPLTKLKTSVPDKGFYLVGPASTYSGSASLDATYSSSTDMLTADSAVYISGTSTAGASIIDLLGMGAATLKETATTSALAAGKSYERKAQNASTASTMMLGGSDEFKGNSSDTNNNSNDFALRDVPQPQNSLSAKEFPFGGPGANDSQAPQVMGSFPGGYLNEMVPNNLEFIGFNFTEPVQENTVTLSTAQLYLDSAPGTNLCQSVAYSNMPQPMTPPGKCTVNPSALPLANAAYTFKIIGDPTNATSSIAVRDFNSNALNQTASHGVSGNYVINFTPSSGGSGFTFEKPPVFVMGALPYPGAVNIPTDIKKITVKFSDNVATSSLNTSNITLTKVGGSAISLTIASGVSESKFTADLAIVTVGATLDANSQYALSISGVTDGSGRSVASFSSNFTTGAGTDATGPLVVGKLPSITTDVPVNAVDIHVMTDDKLDATTISSSTVKLLQGSNELAGTVGFDPFTGEITFLANNVFQANTEYKVRVSAAGSSPCVKNISGVCLQDNDGTANNLYEFTFTTGSVDAQAPRVLFTNGDQRNLSISFDEPINKTEAEEITNYSLAVGGASTTLSTAANNRVTYDVIRRTAVIENLSMQTGASFSLYVSNVHDLSGNAIGSNNFAQGTVQDMNLTKGMVGPGGTGSFGGDNGPMPQNFSTSTFGFVPQIEVRPMSPMVGISTHYGVSMPISKQVKSAANSGKIVLTFPTGFDVTSAEVDTQNPMTSDINGPAPGALTISSVTVDATARTITLGLSNNTRCDEGNATPCATTNTQDFLRFELKGIVNSSIPKDGASGGYTIDIKTMNGTTVGESLTSQPFYLAAAGTSAIVVNLSASGASSGTATVRMFSPLSGPREAVSTSFVAGNATATFSGLVEGDYAIFTDPLITLGAADFMGRSMPTPIRVSTGATSTLAVTLTPTAGATAVTVVVNGPVGKTIDIFANNSDKFMVRSTTTTGTAQSFTLKLTDGTWFIGVGPTMPKGTFNGPPPAPDFVMQPPVQVVISGVTVQESSGTANDGTLSFTLSSASLSIVGQVVDGSSRPIIGAEVFAYSPMGGFGTHGSTDAAGKFNLKVGAGTYQIGAFTPGLPPTSEMAVTVTASGTLVVNGQTVSSIVMKVTKPERSISGKVLDQNNNPVQGAGVFAYCDPSVANNACFGPGDHAGSPTNSDGSFTLYVKAGTWKVGAFLPGFGELPQVTKTVTTADLTDVTFYPSTNTTFYTIGGIVCKDTDVSGNATTCGSGDLKASGVFIRATSNEGSNQTVTDQGGAYTLNVPASASYTIEAFDPALGKLKSLSSVAVSGNVTGKDFVIGSPKTITVNVKNSEGDFVQVSQLFVDFFNFTDQRGNHIEIRNATSGTILLPAGDYTVRASMPGKPLASSAVSSDTGGTAFATSTSVLTIDGNETIKITLPALGIVTGTVYAGTVQAGNELGDAFVQLTDPANGTFIGTQANASGTYAVKLPLGTYNILAQKPGYMANPIKVTVATTTASTTQNITVSQASLSISGTVTISGSSASRAFVMAKRLGGGFAGAQSDSSGAYSLSVNNGVWRVYAIAEGYAETEFSSPIEIAGSSVSGKTINLTTKVTLQAPKVCQIIPAQGGQCADTTNGVSVTVPPSALGSDTNPGSLTIKSTNARQGTNGTTPVGNGFDFEFIDSTGNKVSTFNSALTLEFTQAKSALVASGATTKTKADGIRITLWSEAMSDYDVLLTTVEYLDGSGAVVTSPAEDLSNVTSIRFKALTTHFSGGGPGLGGDSVAPAAPTSVSGSGSATAIGVSWTAPTTNSDGTALSDLSDYRVWRSTSASSGFTAITTVSSPTVTYSDSSVGSGITYYYKVTARDASANESSQSTVSSGVSTSAAASVTVSSGGGGGGGSYTSPATTATTTATVATTTAITTQAPTAAVTTTAQSIVPVLAQVKQAITRVLKLGTVNKEVSVLQEFLAKDKAIYPEGIVSGRFGALTRKAVQTFQEKYGIAKQGDAGYGDVGPKTRAKINALMSGTGESVSQAASVQSTMSAEVRAQLTEQVKLLQAQLAQLLAELVRMLQQKTAQ